jgi:hypothetical protein
MVFGLGSIIQGDKKGWISGGTELAGLGMLITGLALPYPTQIFEDRNGGSFWTNNYKEEYNERKKLKNTLIISGAAVAGVGIVLGYMFPFFYHKPDAKIALADPRAWDVSLASLDGKRIDGVKLTYTVRW